MLGKLIKYDMRSMLRRFGPFWAGLAALAVLNGFAYRYVLSQSEKFSGTVVFLLGILPIALLAVLAIAVMVMSLVFICERFYKGLLGDEGYLMHTLPVTGEAHMAAKTITGVVLELCNVFVAILCALLLLGALGNHYLRNFWQALGQLREAMAMVQGAVWVWTAAYLLTAVVAQILHIYASISLGHLAKNHRAAWSFVAYVAINAAMSYIMVFLLPPLMDRLLPPEGMAGGWVQMGQGAMVWRMDSGFHIGMALLTGWNLLQCAAYFIGADYILKNRLNLE